MNRVTLTIHLDLPDGVVPDVSYGAAPKAGMRMSEAEERHLQFSPDEPPLPDAPPPDMISEAQRIFEVKSAEARVHSGPASTPNCPEGHGPMKFVPAGVSKRSGKEYAAFYGCNDRDCKRTAQAA